MKTGKIVVIVGGVGAAGIIAYLGYELYQAKKTADAAALQIQALANQLQAAMQAAGAAGQAAGAGTGRPTPIVATTTEGASFGASLFGGRG